MSKAYKGTVLDGMSLMAEEMVAKSRNKDLIKQVHEGMSFINQQSNPEDLINSLIGTPQRTPSAQMPPTGMARPIQGMMSQPGVAQSQSRFPNPQLNAPRPNEVMPPSSRQRLSGNKTQRTSNAQENLGMGYQQQQNSSQRSNQPSPAGKQRPSLNYRKGKFRDTRLDNFRTPPSGTRTMGGVRRPPSSGGRYR